MTNRLEFNLERPTTDDLEELKVSVRADVQRAVARGKEIPKWLLTVMWLVEAFEGEQVGGPVTSNALGPYSHAVVYSENTAPLAGRLVEEYDPARGILLDPGGGSLIRVPGNKINWIEYLQVQTNDT